MAVPVLSSISPSQGPSSGGTTVTLIGTGFTGVTAVRFGSLAATSFTPAGSTQIIAVAPPGAGTVTVTVTTGEGATTQPVTYTYVGAPAVTALTPVQGLVSGGTVVTVTGTNLSGATAVRFDTTAAASFTVNSATQITAVTPAHPAGAAPVTVTTAGGTSNPDNPAAYFYYAPPPSVTDVAPSSGTTAGGTTVTLSGSGFLNATTVRFDTTAAGSFTVNSATQITAVTPTRSAGAAPVTVITPGGVSNPGSYLYLAAPTLTALTPGQGPTYAGRIITLTGTGLTTTIGVQFGTAPAAFTVLSPTQITALVPAGSAGTVTVTVTTTAGVSNGLTYTRITGPAI
ncbi:IPT/TIG domain-containing protein [Streptomyces sp. NPDC002619]|uniref:IPT/TIG domain-containing protein n=1 Tax=Streptomyces sp. NPDC002619 TaxID=3364655 RepID=UPI0036ACBCF2